MLLQSIEEISEGQNLGTTKITNMPFSVYFWSITFSVVFQFCFMVAFCVSLGEGDTTPTTTSLDGKFAEHALHTLRPVIYFQLGNKRKIS